VGIDSTSYGNFKIRINNMGYHTLFTQSSLIIYKGDWQNTSYTSPYKVYPIDNNLQTKLSSLYNTDWVTMVDDDLFAFKSDNDRGLYKLNLLSAELTEVDPNAIRGNVVSFNNSVYYNSTNGVSKDGEVILDLTEYSNFNIVTEDNLNTGYGILTDDTIIHGIYADTELDFPNNFYYNYLAYKLAIYYKIKQNADPSGLIMMLSEAEKTFYNTLPRDENNFIRIANAYAY
jgi:hypothetical protein